MNKKHWKLFKISTKILFLKFHKNIYSGSSLWTSKYTTKIFSVGILSLEAREFCALSRSSEVASRALQNQNLPRVKDELFSHSNVGDQSTFSKNTGVSQYIYIYTSNTNRSYAQYGVWVDLGQNVVFFNFYLHSF